MSEELNNQQETPESEVARVEEPAAADAPEAAATEETPVIAETAEAPAAEETPEPAETAEAPAAEETPEPAETAEAPAAEETPEPAETAEAPAAEETPAPAAAAADTEETTALGGKKKKINRLSMAEIDAKLDALDKKSMTRSVYFKHLQQRKKELEPAAG